MKSITLITTLAAAVILTASIPMLRAASDAPPLAPVTPEVQKKAAEPRKALTPEERDARKKAQQAKMEERLALLQKKKDAGTTLTAAEEKQLLRLKQLKANDWKPTPPPAPGGKKAVKTPEKTDSK